MATTSGPHPIEPNAAYTVAEVAAILRLDRRRIWEAMKGNQLRSFVPAGNTRGTRILGSWVIQWMEAGAREA